MKATDGICQMSPTHLLVKKKKKSFSGHSPQTNHVNIEHHVCEHVGMSEAVDLKIHTGSSCPNHHPPPWLFPGMLSMSMKKVLE